LSIRCCEQNPASVISTAGFVYFWQDYHNVSIFGNSFVLIIFYPNRLTRKMTDKFSKPAENQYNPDPHFWHQNNRLAAKKDSTIMIIGNTFI
jgi:hypothetical protein